MTESKKLQTTLIGGMIPTFTVPDAIIHDARIAHEQREVIRQLVDALNNTRPDNARQSREAIDAAAPFLQED